jgi:hypothetical protein
MISNFRFQIPIRGKLLFTFAFLLFTFSCSVPNLEDPECTTARLEVKKFYSFHFANDMKFSAENLKQREKFLTPDFYKSLLNSEDEKDVFTTNSTDVPKAFRLGACKVIELTKTDLEVVLFWRDDIRNEQKTIHLEAIIQQDKWLVNKVLY